MNYYEAYLSIKKYIEKALSPNIIRARKKRCRLLRKYKDRFKYNGNTECPCETPSQCQVPENVRKHD